MENKQTAEKKEENIAGGGGGDGSEFDMASD